MGADIIQGDYPQLEQVASHFKLLHEQQVQMTTQVRRAYEQLSANWIGAGSEAFSAEMENEIFPVLQRLQSALVLGSEVTIQLSSLLREAEEVAAAAMNYDQLGLGSMSEAAAGGDAAGAGANARVTDGGGGGSSGDVKGQIRDALRGEGYDAGAISQILASSTPEQLTAIWSDATLMNELYGEMGTDKYLDFVVQVGMNHTGTVDHTSSTDADAAIQDHLGEYVVDAVAEGKKITGEVAIVDDTNWDIAGIERYSEAVWNSGKRDQINGFVDAEGRVWIHEDRGNPGTMVHEAVHKYSDEAMIRVSQPLNEGVTEYFTRSTTDHLGFPARNNYQGNFEFVSSLATLVGEDAVADAFFAGNMDGLKSAYIDAGFSERQWNTMITHTKNNDWAGAELLTVPAPRPVPGPTPVRTPTLTPTPGID